MHITLAQVINGVHSRIDLQIFPVVVSCQFHNFGQISTNGNALPNLLAIVFQNGELPERSFYNSTSPYLNKNLAASATPLPSK